MCCAGVCMGIAWVESLFSLARALSARLWHHVLA